MTNVSESLVIGIDIADNGDTPALTVAKLRDSKMEVVNVFFGDDAVRMYEQLITPVVGRDVGN